MTSVTEDNLNSYLIDGKTLEALSKLVNELLCSEISKDLYNKTRDILTENHSVNYNIVSCRNYLYSNFWNYIIVPLNVSKMSTQIMNSVPSARFTNQ